MGLFCCLASPTAATEATAKLLAAQTLSAATTEATRSAAVADREEMERKKALVKEYAITLPWRTIVSPTVLPPTEATPLLPACYPRAAYLWV